VVRRSDGAEQAASWWQEHVVEEAIHLLVDRKQRKRIQHGARTRCSPKFVPPVTCFLQLGPISYFPSLPNSARSWEPSLQHRRIWGNIPDPKYKRR
jgi:hypothetical protein